MSGTSVTIRPLGVLGAYLLAVSGAIAGIVLRVLFNIYVRPPQPYHCYDWDSTAAIALGVYLLIVPLAAGFVHGKARVASTCVIAFVALVLATCISSYTRIIGCSPL